MGNKTCLVELDVLISYSIEVSDSIVFGARVDTRYHTAWKRRLKLAPLPKFLFVYLYTLSIWAQSSLMTGMHQQEDIKW